MNTTNTTDIYAVGNEVAWERAVRDALDKVRPGMGDAARADRFNGSFFLWGELGDEGVSIVIERERFRTTVTTRSGSFPSASHREPIGAICLALCEFRRQVEGVTT